MKMEWFDAFLPHCVYPSTEALTKCVSGTCYQMPPPLAVPANIMSVPCACAHVTYYYNEVPGQSDRGILLAATLYRRAVECSNAAVGSRWSGVGFTPESARSKTAF